MLAVVSSIVDKPKKLPAGPSYSPCVPRWQAGRQNRGEWCWQSFDEWAAFGRQVAVSAVFWKLYIVSQRLTRLLYCCQRDQDVTQLLILNCSCFPSQHQTTQAQACLDDELAICCWKVWPLQEFQIPRTTFGLGITLISASDGIAVACMIPAYDASLVRRCKSCMKRVHCSSVMTCIMATEYFKNQGAKGTKQHSACLPNLIC